MMREFGDNGIGEKEDRFSRKSQVIVRIQHFLRRLLDSVGSIRRSPQ